jgi:hypothetical protein
MSTDNDKSWPSIPPSQLRLSRGGAAESAPGGAPESATAPAEPAAGSAPAGAPGGPATPPARRRKAPSLTLRDWMLRGAMVALLLIALGVLLWSYGRLTPLQARGRTLSEQVARLESEIAQMERGYTPADLEQLARDFQFAGATLFGGEDALVAWFNSLKRTAVPLALEANADFGQPHPPAVTNYNVAVVPADLTLNLKPTEDVTSPLSPHARVLALLDTLIRQTSRADLVALEVTAGTNSIAQVRARLELWAGKEGQP